jgi:hypothetical protein
MKKAPLRLTDEVRRAAEYIHSSETPEADTEDARRESQQQHVRCEIGRFRAAGRGTRRDADR